MTIRFPYIVVALSVCFETAFCQATSLLTGYEALMVYNLDEHPKEIWSWDGIKYNCPTKNGVFENIEDCSSFFSYLCEAAGNSQTNCSAEDYQKKCLSTITKICEDRNKVITDSPDTTVNEATTPIGKITTEVLTTTPVPTTTPKITTPFTREPTRPPTRKPTTPPTREPTRPPTREPTTPPTREPTRPPTREPTRPPTRKPTTPPTREPTKPPTRKPTTPPTREPTTTTGPTPPETTCSEDDVDCIIDETGITPTWFICPEDIGSYPHPLSKKLFIFCLNYRPSVKKCGKNLVYSKRLRTCVNPETAEYLYSVFIH